MRIIAGECIVGLTIGLEDGEGLGAALLDELGAGASRESGSLANGGLGDGDGFRAVDELACVVTGDSELSHGLFNDCQFDVYR